MFDNYYFNADQANNINRNISDKLCENERLMKLLFYGSVDALDRPPIYMTDENIMFEIAKQPIIYDKDIKTRIFFSPSPKQTQEDQRVELRFFILDFIPENNVLSKARFCFQIVCFDRLWNLNEGKVRPYEIITEILNSLNGVDIKGIGLLSFAKNPITYREFSDWHRGYVMFGSTRVE
jgi:hypothetical protein